MAGFGTQAPNAQRFEISQFASVVQLAGQAVVMPPQTYGTQVETRPAGLVTQVPTEPATSHESHAALHTDPQQTLSSQWLDAH